MSIIDSPDVLAAGLCVEHHRPDFWHPEPSDDATAQTAIEVCAECPVRDACLAFAMRSEGTKQTSARHGIYGGMTPEQRRSLYRAEDKARRARGESPAPKQPKPYGAVEKAKARQRYLNDKARR